jgi:citrate synthase
MVIAAFQGDRPGPLDHDGSRITGWCAHIMEQHQNNRIMRPLSEYLGSPLRKVVPIDQR